jgi:6-carboxyhexanoate--CoA ligase
MLSNYLLYRIRTSATPMNKRAVTCQCVPSIDIITSAMKNLWSIRMRASKVKTQSSKLKSQNSNDIHISGAEGLYEKSDIQKILGSYIERALDHPKGKADKVIITIEEVKRRPKEIFALPVSTVICRTPFEGKRLAIALLQSLGISKKAIDRAFILIRKGSMRGAAVITAEKGSRLEPDIERGIRASRLGISKSALKVLSFRLSRQGINTDTVKEALILASKVASFRHVVAELCVSDDPDYTTGYIASGKYGYVRIPDIKHKRSRSGGRAFFVKDGINVKEMIYYLEKIPVIINKVASCRGTISLDEILGRSYK